MAKFAKGTIEAFVGPQELGAADSLEDVIVDFINGTKKYLDIAVQELDNRAIAQAILDAKWRGVSVRMFLEQDYLRSDKLPTVKALGTETEEQALERAQWREGGDLQVNREILVSLLRSTIDVKADYNPDIFHQKFIIRDYRKGAMATSALLSGSCNFTETDCHANLNHIVVFHDSRTCRAYQVEFDQIRSGQFGRGMHGEVPKAYNLGGVPVRILFAPDHTPELELVKQMLKCEDRLDFAIFTFAGSSAIDDAMVMLRAAKRRIKGVLDPGQGAQWWAATEWLHECGIKVYLPQKTDNFPIRKLHHKLMVIDEHIVVAGSMNYTAPANEYNDENIFVMGSPYKDLPKKEGGPVSLAECAKLAGFFRDEIERIVGKSKRFTT